MPKRNKKTTKKNKKVVAVSGGFDPLHIGHVRLFREAKKLGDELVVILNNDNWLKLKKGYFFMPEEERKEIIESIDVVNKVIITEHGLNSKDTSICSDLKKIKPHIFANGGDRNKDNIPEVNVCNEIGCEMVFNVGQGGKIQSSSWLLGDYKNLARLESNIDLIKSKSIIIFDLDGTLVESKSNLDEEMSFLLCNLLKKKNVAVIGGGNYDQFKRQFIGNLSCPKNFFKKLYILPTSGGKMYKYNNQRWQIVYKNDLTKEEKDRILEAFQMLNISIDKMVYVGDALYKGGNDSAVFKTSIDTIQVNNIEETKYLIRKAIVPPRNNV